MQQSYIPLCRIGSFWSYWIYRSVLLVCCKNKSCDFVTYLLLFFWGYLRTKRKQPYWSKKYFSPKTEKNNTKTNKWRVYVTNQLESFTTSKTDRHLLYQKVRQRISVIPENWHFNSRFVLKTTKPPVHSLFSLLTNFLT